MRKFIRIATMLSIFGVFSAGVARATPDLPDLGAFLSGKLVAEGKFSDYVAGSTRGMHVKITGETQGETLHLIEEMVYSDGEKRKYVWKFAQENGALVGRRPDLIGNATVTQNKDAVEIAYKANIVLPNGGEQVLDFVETLTFKTQDSAKLKIKVSKFFVPVADAELTVKKIAKAQ